MSIRAEMERLLSERAGSPLERTLLEYRELLQDALTKVDIALSNVPVFTQEVAKLQKDPSNAFGKLSKMPSFGALIRAHQAMVAVKMMVADIPGMWDKWIDSTTKK